MPERNKRAVQLETMSDLSDLRNIILLTQNQINYFFENFLDWHTAGGEWTTDDYIANLKEFTKELQFILDRISSNKSCSFFKKYNARLILEVQDTQGMIDSDVKKLFELYEVLEYLRALSIAVLKELNKYKDKPILNVFNSVRNFILDHGKGGVREDLLESLRPDEQDKLNFQKFAKLISLKIYSISHAHSNTQRKISNFCSQKARQINSPNRLLTLFKIYFKNLDIEYLFNQDLPILIRDFDNLNSNYKVDTLISKLEHFLQEGKIPNARNIRALMRAYRNLHEIYTQMNEALNKTQEISKDISKIVEFDNIQLATLYPEIIEGFVWQKESYNEYTFYISERKDVIDRILNLFSRIVTLYIKNELAPYVKKDIKDRFPVAALYFNIYQELLCGKFDASTTRARYEYLELEDRVLPYYCTNYAPQTPSDFLDFIYMRSSRIIDELMELTDTKEFRYQYYKTFLEAAKSVYKLQEMLDAMRAFFSVLSKQSIDNNDYSYIQSRLLEQWSKHSKHKLFYSTELFYVYIHLHSQLNKRKYPRYASVIDDIDSALVKYEDLRMSKIMEEIFEKEGWTEWVFLSNLKK